MQLIQGKNISDMLSSISRRLDTSTYEKTKQSFEACVGCNYDLEYSDVKILKSGNTEHILLKCAVILLDDDGKKIFKREYIVSNQIHQNNGIPINLSVTIDKAEKEAFRRCIAQFCQYPGIKSKDQSPHAENNLKSDEYMVQITSEPILIEGYNGAFKCDALYGNDKVQLIFWYSVTSKLKKENKWDILCKAVNRSIKIKAKKEFYKNIVQFSVQEVFV